MVPAAISSRAAATYGREAQLRVDRRHQPLAVADLAGADAVGEVVAERLLQQHGGAVGQLLEHGDVRLGRQGDVVDRVGRGVGDRVGDVVVRLGDPVRVRQRPRAAQVEVGEAGDGEAGLRVRGQVRVADDPAGTDQHDRARVLREDEAVAGVRVTARAARSGHQRRTAAR